MGWDEVIDRICQARLEPDWVVGEKAGYHPFTSWFILGELVRIVSGTPLPQYVRQHVFEPLGMVDSWIGMPAARYYEYGTRIATLIDTERPQRAPYRYCQRAGCDRLHSRRQWPRPDARAGNVLRNVALGRPAAGRAGAHRAIGPPDDHAGSAWG